MPYKEQQYEKCMQLYETLLQTCAACIYIKYIQTPQSWGLDTSTHIASGPLQKENIAFTYNHIINIFSVVQCICVADIWKKTGQPFSVCILLESRFNWFLRLGCFNDWLCPSRQKWVRYRSRASPVGIDSGLPDVRYYWAADGPIALLPGGVLVLKFSLKPSLWAVDGQSVGINRTLEQLEI